MGWAKFWATFSQLIWSPCQTKFSSKKGLCSIEKSIFIKGLDTFNWAEVEGYGTG
jgi:hypothetical protein